MGRHRASQGRAGQAERDHRASGNYDMGNDGQCDYRPHMHHEPANRDEADSLIAIYGPDAIATLVSRISDAVRDSDDQAVNRLDRILQLVEDKIETPWRLRAS